MGSTPVLLGNELTTHFYRHVSICCSLRCEIAQMGRHWQAHVRPELWVIKQAVRSIPVLLGNKRTMRFYRYVLVESSWLVKAEPKERRRIAAQRTDQPAERARQLLSLSLHPGLHLAAGLPSAADSCHLCLQLQQHAVSWGSTAVLLHSTDVCRLACQDDPLNL